MLDFVDAQGGRHRRVLGTDKRVAERRRATLINQRDMELDGFVQSLQHRRADGDGGRRARTSKS